MNKKIYLHIILLLLLTTSVSYGQLVCPTNIDFELGTLTSSPGWLYYTGTCCPISMTAGPAAPVSTRHTLMSGTGKDPVGGFPIVAPDGGGYSLRVGNNATGAQAERARYNVRVPAGTTNYCLIYRYAVVLEDPGHTAAQQPRFEVTAKDSATGASITCANATYVPAGGIPGFTTGVGGALYLPWGTGTMDLSGYSGRTVTVDFSSGDCSQSGHFGYGYVDMSCGLFATSFIVCNKNTATLTSPSGFKTYKWVDSATKSITYGSTQTSSISIPSVTTTYAVIITPYPGFGCADTLYTRLIPMRLDYVKMNDTAICNGQTANLDVRATDISMPLTYSWQPSATLSCNTCATPTASPTVTTTYRVEVSDPGGCRSFDTMVVNIGLPLVVSKVSYLYCAGDTEVLTNSVVGGVWTSNNTSVATIGSSTGALSAVAQGTATITYTLGCNYTFSSVTVNPAPGAITGAAKLYTGLPSTFSNTVSGGTWTSSATTIATVGSSSGVANGVASGTSVISYTLAGGCRSTVTATVSTIRPPSITVQPVTQYGCLGYWSAFSITATPYITGHALSYSWHKNGTPISGATSSVYAIGAVANTDTGTSIYSCLVTDKVDAGNVTSNAVSLILNRQAVFNGGSSSWTTGANWSTGVQPDSTVHAYIPAAAAIMPSVTSGTVKCKCVTIETGASLTINGGAIEIAGRINNSGVFDATNGSIVMNGTTVAQTIPALAFSTNTIKDLEIANATGVALGGVLRLTGLYTPTSGIFTTGGFLTLGSSAAGTASVKQGSSAGGYISGDVTVERFIPANSHRAWRLLAPNTVGTQTLKAAWQEGANTYSSNPAPGYGTFITCSNLYTIAAGFDTITPLQSIQLWDVTSQTWTKRPLTNVLTKVFSSEPGYFIYLRGDRTVSPSSSILGSKSTTLRSKGALKMGDQAAITVPVTKGVLVGNPYASAIDFSKISPADRPNLPKRFWLWDPVLTGTAGLGAYVIFDSTTSTPWTPSVSGGSYSAPNSIIPSGMAFLLQPGTATGSITIRESHKVTSSSNSGFRMSNSTTKELHIGLAAADAEGKLNNADGVFALFNDQNVAEVDDADAVKMVNPGENLAIARDGFDLAIEARPNATADDTLYLKMWNMVERGYALNFKPANFNSGSAMAFLHDNYLKSIVPVSLTSESSYKFAISSDQASNVPGRFYVVYKKIGSSTDDLMNRDIFVYPNPVQNSKFTLIINNADAADYNVQLVNENGVSIYKEKFTQSVPGSIERVINLNKNVTPGAYVLSVTKKGKKYKYTKISIN